MLQKLLAAFLSLSLAAVMSAQEQKASPSMSPQAKKQSSKDSAQVLIHYDPESGYIISQQTLQTLPRRDVDEFLPLLPGVIEQDGKLHLRGSRSDAIGYFVEGIPVRDIMTGENIVTIIPEAVHTLQLQAIPINPSFQNAIGGAINHALRSGTNRLHGSWQFETDRFTKQNQAFLDTYSYGYYDYTATLGGPLPGIKNKGKFFVAGQYQFFRDHRRAFWPGFEFHNLVDNGMRGGFRGDSVKVIRVKPGNIPNTY